MRWSVVAGAALFMAVAVATPQAEATIMLGFNPNSQMVELGDSVEVGVVISGLGDYEKPSLGGYDLLVAFDPAILKLAAVEFGDPVLGDQVDISGSGFKFSDAEFEKGVVELYELSFDYPEVLNKMQAGSFTLATLLFNVYSPGISQLNLKPISLSDAFGDALTDVNVASGSVGVVPEPATLLLLGSGLVGIGIGARRRRR